MSQDQQQRTVTIPTSGLLSKWGFDDGDMLDDLLYDNGFGDAWRAEHESGLPDDAFNFDHRVLIRCVETYVLPAVREHHDVTTYCIHTIHNPIRAETLDGKTVDHYDNTDELTPATVDVPLVAVLAIAHEERARHAK